MPERPPSCRRWLGVGAAAVAAGMSLTAGAVATVTEPPSVLPEMPVTASDLRLKMAHNSPMMVADPTDGRFVALASRVDGPDFGCSLHVSADGGRVWAPAQPVSKLPPGAEKCYAPEIAFDGEGRLYYLFVGLHGTGNMPMGAFLTVSTDRARTFSAPRRVLGPDQYMVRLVVDAESGSRGRLHLVWLQTREPATLGSLPEGPNPIVAAYSDDGGETFSKPVPVSGRDRRRPVAPSVAVGPDHVVHVLFYDLGDDARDYHGLEGPTYEGSWSLVLSTSADGGRRYARETVVDGEVTPNERVMLIFTMPPPALAVDGADRVYAAWTDARNGDWDALFARSTDGGGRFASPVRLNDDRAGDGRHQYQPRLDVSPGGRVDAVFYDRRNDPANVSNDVYLTYSTDAGRTFAPNLKLTTEMSDTRLGQTYVGPAAAGLVEWGSRTGLLAQASGAVAAWTDTRVKPFAKTIQQDVFSTRVVFDDEGNPAPRSSGRPLATWLGSAGTVAALGGAVLWRSRRPAKSTETEA